MFVCLYVCLSFIQIQTIEHREAVNISNRRAASREGHGDIDFFVSVPVWGWRPPKNFNFLNMQDTKNFIETKNDLHKILS